MSKLPEAKMTPPVMQAVIDRQAAVLRNKMEREHWKLDKKSPASPELSNTLKNVLITGYRQLIDAIATSQASIPEALPGMAKPEMPEHCKRAQAGAAAKLMDQIMATDDVRKSGLTQDERELLSKRLAGTMIKAAISTSITKLHLRAVVDPEYFGLSITDALNL